VFAKEVIGSENFIKTDILGQVAVTTQITFGQLELFFFSFGRGVHLISDE